jgi:hypothetical protein
LRRNRVFLIGAPKCGTTSLANWLSRHDLIQLARSKEPGYFRSGQRKWILNAHHPDQFNVRDKDDYMSDFSEYERQFEGAGEDVWRLDASTDYFGDPGTCGRIKDELDDNVKIMCVLRDPIDRMYSEYCHTLRDGLEIFDFLGALEAEEERIALGFQPLFFHVRRSKYWSQISRWRSTFGDDRVLVMPYSALRDSASLERNICNFLQIPNRGLGEIPTLNSSVESSGGGFIPGLKTAAKTYAKVILGRNQESLPISYPEFTDEDKKSAFCLIEDDVKRCVSDPSIPSSEWSTCQRFL